MTHWETVVANFEGMMTGEIPAIEVNEWRSTDSVVSLLQAPSVMFHRGYAVLCQGITNMGGEVNTVHTTTFLARLQLAVVMADRDAYNVMVSEVEAIVRQRMRVATWQGVFRQLRHVATSPESLEAEHQWYTVFNCDFEVTVQGT